MTSEHKPENTEPADTETLPENSPNRDGGEPGTPAHLIKLDESKAAAKVAMPAKDINHKITSLDADLAQLRAELSAINNSVEEGLDRLSDTDTDLTAKVSETYKRLGEIDNAYKSLLDISSRIDADIRKLNGDVSVVAKQTATGIRHLERSTIAQSSELAQKNQQVAARVEQLVETSRLSSEMLKEKIQYVTDRIMQVEKNLLADIESLSLQGAKQGERLDSSIEAVQARILKLQSVDEAIIKRATSLEISGAELAMKSRQLEDSVDRLQTSSNTLFTELTALKEQTSALQARMHEQASQIDELAAGQAQAQSALSRLGGRVERHFVTLTMALVFVLLATLGLYFYQQSAFDSNRRAVAGQLQAVALQEQATQKKTAEDIATLERQLTQVAAVTQQQITTGLGSIEDELDSVRDQLNSLEGRFNDEAPFSEIGSDNIIHGVQWLLKQPSQNHVIQVAVLGDRQAMYELAGRYRYYLDQQLSYFTLNDKGREIYVLLSGNYADQRQALAQSTRLPAYLGRQAPVVRQLGEIQRVIQAEAGPG